MFIRKMTVEYLDALWALRLQALTESPEAFGSTYEETVARGKEGMRQRLEQGGDNMFYLGAFDEALVGMVGLYREEGMKSRHKGVVISMYISPEKRGHGIGKALMQELIAQARQLEGLDQLSLAVVTTRHEASRLYHSLGFKVYGTEPRALKAGEQYWDEDLMILFLDK